MKTASHKITGEKVTSASVGGGSSNVSPDWDVKRPDGDAREGWEGFSEVDGL